MGIRDGGICMCVCINTCVDGDGEKQDRLYSKGEREREEMVVLVCLYLC